MSSAAVYCLKTSWCLLSLQCFKHALGYIACWITRPVASKYLGGLSVFPVCVSSGDCGEPVSYIHVLYPAAQSKPTHQSTAHDRRRALPASSRGFRQQDLEEHLAVRPRRPPGLWTRAGHSLWLCRDGLWQQLRVPSLKHGYNEDRAIGLLTSGRLTSRWHDLFLTFLCISYSKFQSV